LWAFIVLTESLRLEKRARGNLQIGQAISQLNFVHQQENYDAEVNTYTYSIAECAQKIVDRLTGFKKSVAAYNTSGSSIK